MARIAGSMFQTFPQPRNPFGQPTAQTFQRLAAMRGVVCVIAWIDRENSFYANGEKCGPSVHGLYEWLNRQPGVRP